MNPVTRPSIVVGIDGSDPAMAAVHWAATEASLRKLPLRVVHAWSVPIPPVAMGPAVMTPDDSALQQAAQHVLDHSVERARASHPDIEVVGELQAGPPASILVEASETAAMLVVGTDGVNALSELILGSISIQCVTHAPCPVAVVPHTATTHEVDGHDPRVVVGIDGSEVSVQAAQAAFEAASLRGIGLTLLHIWNGPTIDPAGMTLPNALTDGAMDEERLDMAETVAGLREQFPDVAVEEHFEHGNASKVLAEVSGNAELVVVGSRGHGGLSRLVLGSTSHSLLQHSRCPVLVVRPGTNLDP